VARKLFPPLLASPPAVGRDPFACSDGSQAVPAPPGLPTCGGEGPFACALLVGTLFPPLLASPPAVGRDR
jgi:hypothetical protein